MTDIELMQEAYNKYRDKTGRKALRCKQILDGLIAMRNIQQRVHDVHNQKTDSHGSTMEPEVA